MVKNKTILGVLTLLLGLALTASAEKIILTGAMYFGLPYPIMPIGSIRQGRKLP